MVAPTSRGRLSRVPEALSEMPPGIEVPNVGMTCSHPTDIAGAAPSRDTSLRLDFKRTEFSLNRMMVL
jgi:hypothetical protein